MNVNDKYLFKHPDRMNPIQVRVETVVGKFIKVAPLDGRGAPWITSEDRLSPIPVSDGLTDAERKLLQAVRAGSQTYISAAMTVSTLPGQKPWKEAHVAKAAARLVKLNLITMTEDKLMNPV